MRGKEGGTCRMTEAQRNLLEAFEKHAIHALAIGLPTGGPQDATPRALVGDGPVLIRPDHHPLTPAPFVIAVTAFWAAKEHRS